MRLIDGKKADHTNLRQRCVDLVTDQAEALEQEQIICRNICRQISVRLTDTHLLRLKSLLCQQLRRSLVRHLSSRQERDSCLR